MQFTQGLHRAVQQKPDAIATVCGERTQTFRQVRDRVARLAAAMQSLGIQRGDVVAIHSLNSDRYIEFYLASPCRTRPRVMPGSVRWPTRSISAGACRRSFTH